MTVSCYLAMTAAEIRCASQLPEKLAYMACHFSPYGTGLSNMPNSLPSNAILILNDRTPICGHDPNLIAQQLSQIVTDQACEAVLLDFQRPGNPETAALSAVIVSKLPCPVGVSELYAPDLPCPVFLSPVPLNQPLSAYLSPWSGREIWLEGALDAMAITVTREGSHSSEIPYTSPPENSHTDPSLLCRYSIRSSPDNILFTLYRSEDQLGKLISQAENLGVNKIIGLYQQLGNI